MAYELGKLEFVFEVTDRKTGDTKEVTTTPSMWARADDYSDTLRATHSQSYCVAKYVNYLVMMACAEAKIIKKLSGIPTTAQQAEFLNRYDIKDVSYKYKTKAGDDEENPTESDQEESQEA